MADKPKPQKLGRSEAKRKVAETLSDARDTPIGNLGISVDDAQAAIERGKRGER